MDEELRRSLRKEVVRLWLMQLAVLGIGAFSLISAMYLIIHIIKLVCD